MIGDHYPAPIVDHKTATEKNKEMMETLHGFLMKKCNMSCELQNKLRSSDVGDMKVFFGL